MKQAFEERRFGKILIPMEMIRGLPHRVQEFFCDEKFFVTEVRYIFLDDAIEYTLVHPKFAPVPEGQIASRYCLKIQAVKTEEGGFENKIVGWGAIPIKKGG